jgi:hypothetical protein
MADLDIGAYAHTLIEDVRAESEANGCDLREAFTSLMLDQLCADGHAEDALPVYFKDHGVEVSGWGSSSDDRCLDLFLTMYSPRADEEHKLDRAATVAAFKRLEAFLARCSADRPSGADIANDVAGMVIGIRDRLMTVGRIRLFLVTNARSVVRDPLPPGTFDGRPVVHEVWDLRRLANWAASGSKAEPIVAEFAAGLPCLGGGASGDGLEVILTVVPGRDLADLYATHGGRLLELNVRSFLQVRGSVNAGMLATLRREPHRFLAYNNGITATASHVEVTAPEAGPAAITRIHNLQIVNGGQTTATIHHAARNKVDINAVRVQMKLTVLPQDQLDVIVPAISAYSNTQNKVSASDLKANSAFHVDVERIMRTLWAPATAAHPHDTHWFYERARGQYANSVAREGTPARQKVFKTANPPAQKFTKAELAKFENTWALRANLVSLGAEKNFVHFTDELDRNPVVVDKEYCRRLVAKAILFRRADKLVAKENFGGYKANIVTYTVARLVHAARGRIDLERIWREQDLSPALQTAITDLSRLVQKVITAPAAGQLNVGEWTKRPECWTAVRDIGFDLAPQLVAELVAPDHYGSDLELVRATSPADWSDLATWCQADADMTSAHRHTAMEIANALARGWDPAGKHLRVGVQLMRAARVKGFRSVTGF